MNDTTEFSAENLINVSTQNNFCGYYVLARRLINDDNFAVVLDKFNQFYQTNWYRDQLADVVKNMHSEQAEIMLGLVIRHEYPLSSGEGKGLLTEELKPICEAFGYNPTIFIARSEGCTDSIKDALQDQSDSRKILILFDPPTDSVMLGHYYLIEPDNEKLAMDASLRDPSYMGHNAINNQGGDTEKFIKNIKKSVAEIKPNWTLELKNQQIQEDEIFAWKLAAYDRRSNDRASIKHFSFFKDHIHIAEQDKAEIKNLQEDEIKHFNDLKSKTSI